MLLWTEKYRPVELENYVWRDDTFKKAVQKWIAERAVPNVLFTGSPGLGKTTAARMILHQIGIPTGDVLDINASKERKIETVEQRLGSFVGTWALNDTGLKYVILDEADKLTPAAQDMLRNDLETFSNTCRFIFTANHGKKISPALQSRLQTFEFSTLDIESYYNRIMNILDSENVDYSEGSALSAIIEMAYPDLRKCINLCQKNTYDGVLMKPRKEDDTFDYLLEFVELMKAGKTKEARTLIVARAIQDEYPDIYRFFYQNLDLWGETDSQKEDALLVIRKGLVYHSNVADIEINLAATVVELCQIANRS